MKKAPKAKGRITSTNRIMIAFPTMLNLMVRIGIPKITETTAITTTLRATPLYFPLRAAWS
jgi:hypothetical protein